MLRYYALAVLGIAWGADGLGLTYLAFGGELVLAVLTGVFLLSILVGWRPAPRGES